MNIEPGKTKIGIVGAGTMGAGIALAALYKGFEVALYDPFPEALEKGRAYIEQFLAKKGLEKNKELLTFVHELDGLAGCDFVIEAALEDLEMKQDIFTKLDAICPPPAILATNTSTLTVTAIASVTQTPERMIGMHFFNPAAVLPLVEVVRAANTSEETIAAVVALAEALDKEPVVTGDTPGFIVNRVARPFYGEALRLLGEGVATVEEIDWLVEKGAGFKMGPFRLMDLIGIDVNTKAMQSLFEQTYGEPRYRPHPIQIQKVATGELGRKVGKGFYGYGEEKADKDTHKHVDKETSKQGQVMLISEGSWGVGVRAVCEAAGYRTETVFEADDSVAGCLVVAAKDEDLQGLVSWYDNELPESVPLLVQTADVTEAEAATWLRYPQRLVGFDPIFIAEGGVLALAASPVMVPEMRAKVDDLIDSLGLQPVWVEDSPAMILPRIVCQLINEAAFSVLEGVAEPEVIDKAMRLGVNYPKGPLEWGKEIGYDKVVAVLDHLWEEYREERYRACRLLRKWARMEKMPPMVGTEHSGR
ncbi:MAG: 3-hydroxyacyl-CoA dehydrogenase NAD-binding domain-containing protein [Anaerolineae bacterium]|nr:3-hydroxyacyl-CoA dehydrogenase NAD-binding domain-containing protein [Anaerolineae bacterium]